jgi:thiosulfate reductase cytochrome b subunit
VACEDLLPWWLFVPGLAVCVLAGITSLTAAGWLLLLFLLAHLAIEFDVGHGRGAR